MSHRPAELWFVCGSQHLYGPEALDEVAHNAGAVAAGLAASPASSVPIVSKGVVTTPEEIRSLALHANSSEDCAGLVIWMHTFSPARMWIGGLSVLAKPFCHLHTQFGRDLPWATIDMDFMNLHQAAHGDREAGHLHTRMRLDRKVVVGHWQDPGVHAALDRWGRAAAAWLDLQGAPFARFGDNMRQVAVTEGDKVSAELRFGFSFQGYGVGDLVERVDAVDDADIDELVAEYADTYDVAPELLPGADRHPSLREGAAIELGLRSFLEEGGFVGFTTNFEDLHGLRQLPGLAVQRLMADGYGFGAEGDWKTAAMVRAVKVMGRGRPGGTSFMEDYTYHLGPEGPLVLGAHMLETCPTIAEGPVRVEVHPLGIGGKADPVRLVFDAGAGPAVTTCVVDLGNRFRMVTQDIETIVPPPMPKLPVGRAVWRTAARFETATAGWILAGGSHHTVLSRDVDAETLDDFATIAGVEHVHLRADTDLRALRQDLRTNEVFHLLAHGISG